jgi:hypothetical protein
MIEMAFEFVGVGEDARKHGSAAAHAALRVLTGEHCGLADHLPAMLWGTDVGGLPPFTGGLPPLLLKSYVTSEVEHKMRGFVPAPRSVVFQIVDVVMSQLPKHPDIDLDDVDDLISKAFFSHIG